MSKHINTHLFFHMNDTSSSKQKDTTTSTTTTKPKKPPSSLISGYEIDTNPPLPSESGDYYDYYTNYGIPEYYGPLSPSTSPPYVNYNNDYQYYSYDRNPEYDYYHNSDGTNYREGYTDNGNAYAGGRTFENFPSHIGANADPSSTAIPSTSSYYQQHQNAQYNCSGYLPAPLLSPPAHKPKRTMSSSPGDMWSTSYRNDHRGLSAFAHKLHRITFVEACIFQPPDLPSPVRASAPGVSHHSVVPGSSAPIHPPRPSAPPVLAQGERSPTSTGGTQYYQEWASKHMRHLCSRFEKPDQQQLLMNVERKSKYPFIILCTPDHSNYSKSSSISSSNRPAAISHHHHHYHREISHHSAYSLEEDDDDEEEEEHWITQKQRDSVNSHYLPPPPPPLLMPHIWPEIRYIDGLYTVCASIVRPGSGVPTEFDEYLYSDINSTFDQSGYQQQQGVRDHYVDHPHSHHQQQEKHISFQDQDTNINHADPSTNTKQHHGPTRPAGYIVSAFATFPGEDSDRLEKNWLFWTGARILYKYLPTCVGLRRLIFLKRCPDMYREDLINQQSKIKPTIFTGFTYVLLCECFNLKENYIASVCTTIDQLRARCCGYSALYLTHFQQQQQQQQHPHQQQNLASLQQQQHHHQSMVGHHRSPVIGQHSHQQQQIPPHPHPHHHIPRHHRSINDFNDYDGD